jgi:hypothetical protein
MHDNYQLLIEYLCMFRIDCKPIYANHINLAKICLIVIKSRCS